MSFPMRSRNVRVFWTGDGPAKIRSPGSGSRSSPGCEQTQRGAAETSFRNFSACFPDAMSARICAPFNGVSARSGRKCSKGIRKQGHPKDFRETGLPLPSFRLPDQRQRVWTLLPFLCAKGRALLGVLTRAHPTGLRRQKSCRHARAGEHAGPSPLPQLPRKETQASSPGVLQPSHPHLPLILPRRRKASV